MKDSVNKRQILDYILTTASNRGISMTKLIDGIYDYSHFNRMCNGKEDINVTVLFYCCIKLNINLDDALSYSSNSTSKSLNDYYHEFSQIRLKRDYKQLPVLYRTLSMENMDGLSTLINHVHAIIDANNQQYNSAINHLKLAYKNIGNKLSYDKLGTLTIEQIEIIIDYALCLYFVGDNQWEKYLSYLYNIDNCYAPKHIIDFIYPKICYNFSLIYLRLKDYDRSLQICKTGVVFAIKKNNFILAGFLYYNLAICQSCLNKRSSASLSLQKSKNIFYLQNRSNEFISTYTKDKDIYFKNIKLPNE